MSLLDRAPFALLTLDGRALDRVIDDYRATPNPRMVEHACDTVRVVDANPFAAALLHGDDPAVLLRPMGYLFAATPGVAGRIIAARLAGRGEHVEDITVRRFDGRPLDVLLHVTFPPPTDATGAILVLMIDVTGRLRGDASMASIAHEVRQPLSAIVTNTDAALRWLDHDTPRLDRVRPLLARIGANARRAGDLLLQSQRAPHEHRAEQGALDVNAVVAETCELVRYDAEERGIDLHIALADAPARVRGDRVQLQQVIFNLLMNAVQAIDQSAAWRRQVSIGAWVGDDAVRVSVSDTGPGVPATDLDRIFLRAFTTKPDGMGLGLAICRSIVEAHHGAIRVSNVLGGGARFEVALPVACAG